MADQPISRKRFDDFERTTRQIRWLSILVVLVTFPLSYPQTHWVYGLLGLAVLFNLSRYIPYLRQTKLYNSPIAIMIADCLFAGMLIALVGSVSTPYSAFFVFVILTAAYLYRMAGVVAVVLLEALMLFLVSDSTLVTSVVLSQPRILTITLYALFSFGFLVTRLTQRDQVERNTLEEQGRKSNTERSRLQTLVDSLNNAIFVTDANGHIVQYNEAARVLADSLEDMTGRKFSKVLYLKKRTDTESKQVDILEDGSSAQHRRDLCLVTSADIRTDLDISVTPVQSGGKSTEFIIVCEDISGERSLDEQRSEFIAVASHELRTPLAIVEAALETALSAEQGMSPQTKTLLEQAHRNAMQLASITKDLTMLAESKNDNIPIQLAQIQPGDILAECIKDFEAQAQQKGIVLKKALEPGIGTVLSTQAHILEILQNYLTNALKYSQQGTITLKAESAKHGGIVFSVTDEGIGISPHDQKLLFTKFFRAEDYRTRATGGTGLGLYLCMELAQRLGGKLWCKSTPNVGSTFYLEVPPLSRLARDQGDVVKAQVSNLVDGL